MKKIDAAAAAAADDARMKIDFKIYSLIYDCLVKLRFLPGVKARFLQEVKCLADEISRLQRGATLR